MKYHNPIVPGFYPDPSVCRAGEDFYLVTSSFEYFPGVPVFHSKNLVNWTQIGHCLTRRSQLEIGEGGISRGIFAPTIRYHNGRFYMVTTSVNDKGNFFVWTDDPAGEWSEPVWVDQAGIDPDLFWDEDGSAYFTSTSGFTAIAQSKIDIETGERLSDTTEIWTGCGGKNPEAPHIYKINDYYYIMVAEGGTEYGHCVTIGRGKSPYGPWENCPHNPILTHRSSDLPIQATGHADLVEDSNGSWWMVCLGIRPLGYHLAHNLGRETFLAPVRWEDGWPIVGENARIAPEMEGHDGLPAVQAISYDTHDSFEDPALPLYWNFLCNPDADSWSLTEKPDSLTLHCMKPDLDEMVGLAWLGRRQQHYKFEVRAALDFTPDSEHEEAGITAFQNMLHHYEIALTNRDGAPCLIVRRRIGSLCAEVACKPVEKSSLTLLIQGDEKVYRLGYITDTGAKILAEGEIRYLSSEVGGRFTGVYLAMYATAHGQESQNKAHFTRFDYKAL